MKCYVIKILVWTNAVVVGYGVIQLWIHSCLVDSLEKWLCSIAKQNLSVWYLHTQDNIVSTGQHFGRHRRRVKEHKNVVYHSTDKDVREYENVVCHSADIDVTEH